MGKSRRGRGEGSIFFRPDGLWAGTLTIGYDENGKRKRRTVYGKTKQDVREKLARLQSASLNGMITEPNRISLAQFLGRWLEDAARPSIRPSTYIQYERMLRLHINPNLGGVALNKLTPAHIQGLYATLERQGASPRLRQIVHAVLHRSFKQAVKWGLLHRNLCEAVDKPKAIKKAMKVLSEPEMRRFLEVAKDERLYALYVLALATGMRQGELLGLQWPEVDLKAGTISVQFTLIELQGQLYRSEPKSAKGRRLIKLPEYSVVALAAHKERMLVEQPNSPWVFCGSTGKPIWKSNLINKSFKPLLAKAGLPSIRFHDLRHSAATYALSNAVHPKIVQERLGHSQISLTLDTYSHVLPTMQEEAAVKLNRLFENLHK